MCCLCAYCQPFPNFCNHQLVINTSVSSPERPYIEHIRMSSIYQYSYVIDLVASLAIRRVSGVFMNVPVWEHRALYNQIFHVAMFSILTQLSLLSWRRLPFPIVSLKIFSSPTFSLISPTRIFIWYLRNSSKPCSNSSLNLSFEPSLFSSLGACNWTQWYYTSDLSELYDILPPTNSTL